MPNEVYDPQEIETKWQAIWEDTGAFVTPDPTARTPKTYILDFFPYPSGSGLHVGHVEGYTASDILARQARRSGRSVLHPIGWDAFGLPAENYAIKTGIHPAISTRDNIANYRRQCKRMGFSYDWSREINTSDPAYYKWTQWFFALLYKRGLAYRKMGLVNWCSKCQTVLANEQVVGGACERCGTQVIQRELKQWYFRITDYAERLLAGLDTVDWPEKIKSMQRNWIGKSEGALLHFPVEGAAAVIDVFTTRPDTVYGATYVVLAPEHPLVDKITAPEYREAVRAYQEQAGRKTELERTHLDKEKTGAFTGAYAVNPATGSQVPIWVADYVVVSYGMGAIMAVPAHDERDFAFATAYNLPIVQVIDSNGAPLPYTGDGALVNSGAFTGTLNRSLDGTFLQAIHGTAQTVYRLRDWLVSRQRFWGAPIPVAYDEGGEEYLLSDDNLPVVLPDDVDFLPTGQSPLALANDWKRFVDPTSGKELVRETDTLDTFVCSSWYYLRFPTPWKEDGAFDREAVRTWLPVDMYIGGAEHAVLHLLYARFFTKVLFDEGLIDFEEPFQSLRNPGMILGPDHNKMSKSKGNVINPDDVIAEHGADTLRTYEMFLAPFDQEKPWSTTGIVGVSRFLEKVWRLQDKVVDREPDTAEQQIRYGMVRKVTEDLRELKFNTAVSALMEAVNAFMSRPNLSKEAYLDLVAVLNPFAPHITEELWDRFGGDGLLSQAPWPAWDESYLVQEVVEYAVQVNGKVRGMIQVKNDATNVQIRDAAAAEPRVAAYLDGKTVVKEIVVPGRLVSFVTTD